MYIYIYFPLSTFFFKKISSGKAVPSLKEKKIQKKNHNTKTFKNKRPHDSSSKNKKRRIS